MLLKRERFGLPCSAEPRMFSVMVSPTEPADLERLAVVLVMRLHMAGTVAAITVLARPSNEDASL